MKYRAIFSGRAIGAIGVTHRCMVEVETDSQQQAVDHLYGTHEHISVVHSVQEVGTLGGLCNRRVCRDPNARWYNRGSYAHYCKPCALAINSANPDSEPLCSEVTA